MKRRKTRRELEQAVVRAVVADYRLVGFRCRRPKCPTCSTVRAHLRATKKPKKGAKQ